MSIFNLCDNQFNYWYIDFQIEGADLYSQLTSLHFEFLTIQRHV